MRQNDQRQTKSRDLGARRHVLHLIAKLLFRRSRLGRVSDTDRERNLCAIGNLEFLEADIASGSWDNKQGDCGGDHKAEYRCALRGATSADHLTINLLINEARTDDQSETSNPTIV